MAARPAPPPRRVRRCKHGYMKMEWIVDASVRAGGYWSLTCDQCEAECKRRGVAV